jgi:hypothetical protein
MSSFGSVITPQDDNESGWLHSQFQQACLSLLNKPSYRRGPFIFCDEDLKAVAGEKNDSVRPQLPSASERSSDV